MEKLLPVGEVNINIQNKKYIGEMCIDNPVANSSFIKGNNITLSGWAVSQDENAVVEYYIDNKLIGTAQRYYRADIEGYNRKYNGKTLNAGYGKLISSSGLSEGKHTITVYQKSRYGDIITGVSSNIIITSKNTTPSNTNKNDSNSNKTEKTDTNSNYNIPNTNVNGTQGIDVSQYQGNIDWRKVANSGVKYALIRIGYRGYKYGNLVEDTKFKTNFQNAVNNGIKVGVYIYSTSINENEAKGDAEYVYKLLKKYGYQNKISMPIVIDLELVSGQKTRDKNLSKLMRTKVANTFCSTIKNYGYTPMVYACKSFLNSNLNSTQIPYDIWVAQYNSKCTYSGKYTMWQYTEKGKISGITGNVDCNICYKNY